MSNTHLTQASTDKYTAQSPLGDYRCQRCYGTATKLGAGKAPHTASLLCADCGRWIKWVGKTELAKLTGCAR
jgi:hypothetical protein